VTLTTINITVCTDCYFKWKNTMFSVRYELNLDIESRLIYFFKCFSHVLIISYVDTLSESLLN